MNIEFNSDKLIFEGDNHGLYKKLFDEIDRLGLRGRTIIHGGDGGEGMIGFDREFFTETLNEEFKKRDIQYYVVKGNHSCPAYFDGSVKASNLFLMPDYTVGVTSNGTRILFVGGEISIDRIYRTEGVDYWKDEGTVYQTPPKVDVAFFHGAPTKFNNPTSTIKHIMPNAVKSDKTLISDCIGQRKILDRILDQCGAKVLYGAHFHQVKKQKIGGVSYRCLAANELLEVDFSSP